MAPRTHNAGFSLLELMIVVALIGVLAAMMAPNLTAARADAEAANATVNLVRLGSRARAHAMATNLAHLLAWTPDANGNDSIVLLRGMRPRCNMQTWDLNKLMAVETENNNTVLRVGRGNYTSGSMRLRLLPVNGAMNLIQICFQPNGDTLLRNGNAGIFLDNIGGVRDVLFNIFHEDTGGVAIGIRRQVIFPSSNVPRWVH